MVLLNLVLINLFRFWFLMLNFLLLPPLLVMIVALSLTFTAASEYVSLTEYYLILLEIYSESPKSSVHLIVRHRLIRPKDLISLSNL